MLNWLKRLKRVSFTLLVLGIHFSRLPAQETAPSALPSQLLAAQHTLYQLPDSLSAPLRDLSANDPIVLQWRDWQGMWYYVKSQAGLEGWLPFSALTPIQDAGLVPVRQIDPNTLLMTVQYWNFGREMTWLYQYGQSLGNEARMFAKVGDSISVSRNFLHPFGAGVYTLGSDYAYLEPTITFYNGLGARNPFSRNSGATGTGWTTRNVLQFDPACGQMVTRLACEYQLAKPAIALIMLGTNDVGYIEVSEYQNNLRRIIEISFQLGVIPVLSTIPAQQTPFVDDYKVQQFNAAIFALGDELNIPVWNYWLVLQNLPNRGLNEDGVHPSSPPNSLGVTLFDAEHLQYGYTVRNLMALQSLYLLRWNVMGLP